MARKVVRTRRTALPAGRSRNRNLLRELGLDAVDFKDTATLRMCVSERGKIRSRHVTGLSVQQQRQLATAIKNSREMALMPYPGPHTPR